MRRLATVAALVIALLTPSVPALPKSVSAAELQPAAPPLVLLKTIETGGMPDSIVVDTWQGRNDVLFYDLATSTVKWLNGDSLTLLADEIALPSWAFDSWMAYDAQYGHTYVLQTILRTGWQEVMVSVLNRRELLTSFSVNGKANANSIVDKRYVVAGFVAKPALTESGNTTRLFIDNTYGGNIDVVDLDSAGVRATAIQRWSYRSPLTTDKWWSLNGNSLALEPRRETLANDDLAGRDILYLLDGNTAANRIRAVRIRQAPPALEPVELPAINLTTFPMVNGVHGLSMNGPRDRLLIGTALQSFDEGTIGMVRTTDHVVEETRLLYAHPGFVLADWYDPQRVFVTAFDGFWNDPDRALYLRLLYGGQTYSLTLEKDWTEEPRVRDMAFAPYHRRLYITVEPNSQENKESRIYVVEVNVGAGAPPLPPARPAVATALLFSPWYGGMIEAPDDRAKVVFPPNSVDRETEVVYAETPTAPSSAHLLVRAFNLTAAATADNQPVTSFLRPYWITLHYTNAELGPVDEKTLIFAVWNGSRWAPVPGAQIDKAVNEIVASLDHMSLFAVLGDAPEQLFLPCMEK